MGSSPSPASSRIMTSQPATTLATHKATQFPYTSVPRGLLLDLRDTPLAIGIYTLIMRLVLVAKAPVPLSVGDILAYDPCLNRGQVIRAIKRLVGGGWSRRSSVGRRPPTSRRGGESAARRARGRLTPPPTAGPAMSARTKSIAACSTSAWANSISTSGTKLSSHGT
jgi:hypothetical protein